MSSKHGFLNRSTALAAGVGFAALISVALLPPPALADKWKHHHHGHYDYDGRGYVVVPGYVYRDYYSPPPVYYAPPASLLPALRDLLPTARGLLWTAQLEFRD